MTIIIVSLSGGKDSTALLLHLVQRYGAQHLLAHYQVLPEDWPGTLAYNQRLCAGLRVPLVAQQMLYAPVGDGTAVRRRHRRRHRPGFPTLLAALGRQPVLHPVLQDRVARRLATAAANRVDSRG